MHKDLKAIWPTHKYKEELHDWLLQLTEEFDLTFKLKNEPGSIIPCLLGLNEPKVKFNRQFGLRRINKIYAKHFTAIKRIFQGEGSGKRNQSSNDILL